MGFAVTLAIYAGLYVLSKILASSQKPPSGQQLARVAAPPEGTPIPVYWGRVRFDRPAVVWNSARKVARIVGIGSTGEERGEDTYAWKVHAMLILGIPQDTYGALGTADVRFARLFTNGVSQQPFISDRNVTLTFATDDVFETTSDPDVSSAFQYGWDTPYTVQQQSDGYLFFESGVISRGDNCAMGGRIFVNALPGNLRDEWPAYRGQTKIFLSDRTALSTTLVDDHLQGFAYADSTENPSGELPAWEVEATSLVTLDLGGGRPLIQPVFGNDANPAGVIFDVLTAPWAKLGMDPADLDLDSFAAAGETLYDEGHGFSMVLYDTTTGKDLIRDILAQIDAVMYEDPETRKLVLSLTREDYDAGTLPTFSPANVVEIMQLSVNAFDETYNEMRVVFRDRAQSYKDATAVAQDMANLASQGGRVRAVTRSYPGVNRADLAAQLAARDLAEVSVPLMMLRMRVNRDAHVLRPNLCFKLTWPEYGLTDVIFRVANIETGTLEDGTIIIEAAQDRFAVTSGLMTPPKLMPTPVLAPRAIERRLFTEAPRWFLRKAVARSINTDIDTPRGYYLGAQPETASTGYMSRISDAVPGEETFIATDRQQVAYPRHSGTVETAYSRTLDPYDTGTGLRVTFDRPILDTITVGTASAIARGANVIYVGGEIMAFETYTFISGTTYRLNNVWRGLLDTTPVDHDVGEAVFVLGTATSFDGDFFTGNQKDLRDIDTPMARMLPLTDGRWMSINNDAVEHDALGAPRGRTLLPYPSADVQLEGTKGTSRREEEGFLLSWKRRNMNYTTITRGDAASQIVDTTQYEVIAQKIGPRDLVGEEVLMGIATSGDESMEVAAAEAGYGTLAVFPRTVDLSTNFTNWQDPALHVEFPCWRNLLANCRFADVFANNVTQPWTIVSGDATRVTAGLYPLGGTGVYVSNDGTDTADIEFNQTVFLGAWPSRFNMAATLTFYARTPGTSDTDAADTLLVEVIARDSGGTQVGIATTGTFTPTDWWQFHRVTLANLPSTTRSVRVRVLMAANDEPPEIPDIAVAEFALRVGQLTVPTVNNPSFDTDMSSWTVAAGSFTRQTTVPYIGSTGSTGGYARGGTSTSNEIFQDIALPTGYESGTVVLEYAQGDEGGADNDLGYAQIDARSSGGTVLASANSPAIKAVTTPSSWARRRVVLENIPVGTANIRVRLIATRTAAGTADACFDDIRVVMFKELDPDYKLDLSATTPPNARFPRTRSAWYDYLPSFPPPDVMLYDGERLDGDVGIEADLRTPTTPYLGTLVGPYDADHDTWTTSAYDFRPGCEALEAVDDGAGHFANFAQGESFTIIAVVRPGEGNTTTRRICGRIDGSTGGWCLEFLSTGRFQARIRSGGTTWTASPTAVALPGGLYVVQMSYDSVGGQLSCAVNSGTAVNTAVPAGTSIWANEALLFRIGKAEAADTLFNGQVARVYGWRDVYGIMTAQMDQYGKAPPSSFATVTALETGQLMVPVGEDDEGNEILAVYGPGHIPLGRLGGQWGYSPGTIATNICPSRNLLDAAAWPVNGTAVATRLGIVGPTGQGDAVRIASTVAGDGVRVINVPFSSSPTVFTYFWARAVLTGTTGNLSVRLENSSGTLLSNTVVALTHGWKRFRVDMSLWDDSTANGQIRFCPHSAGAPSVGFELANVVVTQSTDVLHALPYGASSSGDDLTFNLTSGSITEQFNREGEIYVEGRLSDAGVGAGPVVTTGGSVIFRATNGTNNNDRRDLSTTNSAASLAHYNATGTSATGTTGALTWASPTFTLRGRWQTAGLLDSTTSWARVLKDATAASARAATFTASTTPLTTLTLQGGVQGIVTRVILFARELILDQAV